MKSMKLMGALVMAGLGLATISSAPDVWAQKKPKKEDAPPAPAPDPPVAKTAIKVPMDTVSFGISSQKLGDIIEKVIDEDYKPKYKDVSPGVKMKALDAQLAEEKAQFRRSKVDFGKIPTGMDASALKGEYTYNNKESVMSITRNNETTYFFFIGDKLWKIIVERTLNDQSTFGKNYQDVVTKYATTFGVPGRILQPDATRTALEVDWKDGSTHLRVIKRSDTSAAWAYVDNSTEGNLSSLRTNKPVEDNGIDPSVAAIMRKNDDQPGPPPSKDDKKPKPKK